MSLELIIVIIKKYLMADLCNWTRKFYLRRSWNWMGVKVSRLGVHFCLLALTLSSFVQFSKIRRQNLSWSFLYQTKHNLFIYLVSKFSNTCTRLYTFSGTPGSIYQLANLPRTWLGNGTMIGKIKYINQIHVIISKISNSVVQLRIHHNISWTKQYLQRYNTLAAITAHKRRNTCWWDSSVHSILYSHSNISKDIFKGVRRRIQLFLNKVLGAILYTEASSHRQHWEIYKFTINWQKSLRMLKLETAIS